MDKKILIAASPSISTEAIRYNFPENLEKLTAQEIVIVEGNLGLQGELLAKWPAATLAPAKSRSEILKLLQQAAHLIIFWDGEDLTKLLFEARLRTVPTKVIPIQVTRVVNKDLTDNYDIYIGRGSPWGNPFAIGHGDGPDRAEVIKRYEEHFKEKLKSDRSFRRGVLGLRGLRLACFCKPAACHGDVIAAYLDRFPRVETDDTNLLSAAEIPHKAGEIA